MLAKEAAENSAKYYSVVMKVKKTDNATIKTDNDKNDHDKKDEVQNGKKKSSKKATKEKVPKKSTKSKVKNTLQKQASIGDIPWVKVEVAKRKPTKVYRRTDSNRNSLQGKTLENVVITEVDISHDHNHQSYQEKLDYFY